MKIDQLGAQLFTLRDYLKTPADIADTLKKVRKIGYKTVQVSGMGKIDEAELTNILQGEGLSCVATHESPDDILNNPEKVVDRLNKLDCKYTAYPFPAGWEFVGIGEVLKLASALNDAGKVLYENGKVLTYHNHSIEFQRVESKLILDILYENTDKRYLQGEIDTYWVQHGGCNPIKWCEMLFDRLPLLHLKDYRIKDGNVPAFAEVGTGNLDWKPIIEAAEASGCRWYLVEQDECDGDPFESLKKSYDYVKENLAE